MPQRSPVIFWLLLAATLCVDAVAFLSLASEPYPDPVEAVVAFHALVLSQLSVVCIWYALSPTKDKWARIAPVLAVVLAASVTAVIDDPMSLRESFRNYVGYYGVHAALLLTALWLFQQTMFWRRRNAVSRPWQYSIAHLLIAMTIVAVLAAIMRDSPLLGDGLWINIVFAFGSVALAVASVFFWRLPWHWLLRLASVFGCAILLGFAFVLGAVLMPAEGFTAVLSALISTHYLIEGILLSAWLGCGPILPEQATSGAAGS